MYFCVDIITTEPSAAMVKELEQLAQNPVEFEHRIGCAPFVKADLKAKPGMQQHDVCGLYHALWGTSSAMMAASSGSKKFRKKILLFTSDADPSKGDFDMKQKILTKWKDVDELGISLDLFDLESAGEKFDRTRFFQDLIESDEDSDPFEGCSAKMEDMKSRMDGKVAKKRVLSQIDFDLGDDTKIALNIYCSTKVATKDTGIILSKKDNMPLKGKTEFIDTISGERLQDFQMKKYYPYGGEKVIFTDEEMATIKRFAEPGLVLMGFKPVERLKVYYSMKAPYFAYPNERGIEGSTVLFNALLKQMENSKKMAVCRLVARTSGPPRFVALVPQLEEIDPDTRKQTTPPGFHMLFLPYAEEIRKGHPFTAPTVDDAASDDTIRKTKDLMDSMTASFVYAPSLYNNPLLQKFYQTLHALALDGEPTEFHDNTKPNEESLRKRDKYVKAALNFTACFKDLPTVEEKKVAGRKRAVPAAAEKKEPAQKKVKKEEDGRDDRNEVDGGDEDANMKALIESDQHKKLTIPQLKEFLKLKGLAVGGKKDDLIQRVEGFFI